MKTFRRRAFVKASGLRMKHMKIIEYPHWNGDCDKGKRKFLNKAYVYYSRLGTAITDQNISTPGERDDSVINLAVTLKRWSKGNVKK